MARMSPIIVEIPLWPRFRLCIFNHFSNIRWPRASLRSGPRPLTSICASLFRFSSSPVLHRSIPNLFSVSARIFFNRMKIGPEQSGSSISAVELWTLDNRAIEHSREFGLEREAVAKSGSSNSLMKVECRTWILMIYFYYKFKMFSRSQIANTI